MRPHRRQAGQSVDLTPLIDIVFQLLIFFLLTATFQQNPSFKVKLPKANNKEVSQEPKAVVVAVGSDGSFEVDGKVVDRRELELRLCNAAKSGDATGVNIKADQKSEYQYVIEVLDVAKTCGLERLGMVHGR
jgi:biopolymer transport protein ExbD